MDLIRSSFAKLKDLNRYGLKKSLTSNLRGRQASYTKGLKSFELVLYGIRIGLSRAYIKMQPRPRIGIEPLWT